MQGGVSLCVELWRGPAGHLLERAEDSLLQSIVMSRRLSEAHMAGVMVNQQ